MTGDYSEITAGRSTRLAELNEELASGHFHVARELALRDYVDSARLLRWIDRRIATQPERRSSHAL